MAQLVKALAANPGRLDSNVTSGYWVPSCHSPVVSSTALAINRQEDIPDEQPQVMMTHNATPDITTKQLYMLSSHLSNTSF